MTAVVKVKKLHPFAQLPMYATLGAACFDLHALVESYAPNEALVVTRFEPLVVRTGLSFEIPEGYVMLIYSRSGHGFKNGVRLANCVGVIDSDYRGEVMVKLTSDEPNNGLLVKQSDRIAQAMIVKLPKVCMIESDELSSTERGAGGFGSTG